MQPLPLLSVESPDAVIAFHEEWVTAARLTAQGAIRHAAAPTTESSAPTSARSRRGRQGITRRFSADRAA